MRLYLGMHKRQLVFPLTQLLILHGGDKLLNSIDHEVEYGSEQPRLILCTNSCGNVQIPFLHSPHRLSKLKQGIYYDLG
ncbi:hypothetical protein D3C77_230720 [compost metagenome]